MATIKVESTRDVAAPTSQVYKYIADFKTERPRWLPDNYHDYKIEKGGKGAGTVYSYGFKVGSRDRTYHMTVAEPRTGAILTEKDGGSTLVSTWTVTAQGAGSRVTLVTEWQGHGGVGGFFERLFAPAALKKVYDDALSRLATVATEK